MKVIHYIGSLGFGGIERLVYNLVNEQNKRQVLETGIGVGKLKGEFKTQFESLNTQLIDFDLNSGFDLNPFKILRIAKHFKRFDVLHLHGFHVSVALAAVWSRKKIIYTEHGNFGLGRQIKTSDRLSFFFRKLFFKSTKTVICCNSKFTKQYVETKFYSGKRLKIVYNGSALNHQVNDNLKRKLKEKYDANYIIGTSSRLAGFKKVDRLIAVFAQYIKVNPKSLLVIVGDGVERENLEKQVSEFKLQAHVVFEGYQSEVATYQSIFDVSVFPSLNEPFGLVAIECYSQKKPVLVFNDGGGITEIVSRFEPKDVCLDTKVMIERLNYYFENEFAWKDHHIDQLSYFSVKRMEQDYYNEYTSIVRS
ncbi:glycosyltransferase [uncultured Psychroserpens sp.]|uniref:glycosyltransferase n=1 Tax=uncultured Psychroserpens sp. TaxID=255436 RepID=UPI00262530D9|nr:glycosyltransferase [uncultured Psychroserpens sp.]